MIDTLLAGLAVMLVLEGLLPLIVPRAWREAVRHLAGLNDGQLRFIGLCAIAAGAVLFYLVMP